MVDDGRREPVPAKVVAVEMADRQVRAPVAACCPACKRQDRGGWRAFHTKSAGSSSAMLNEASTYVLLA